MKGDLEFYVDHDHKQSKPAMLELERLSILFMGES